MKVYEVETMDGEPAVTYGTKGEAITAARQAVREDTPPGETAKVDELTLAPIDKALIVRLINVAGGYVVSRRTVATFTRERDVP